MKLLGQPRLDSRTGNSCGFCEYWEGDAQIHSHGAFHVEYEDVIAHCLKRHTTKHASSPTCPDFEMSYSVRKYCRR